MPTFAVLACVYTKDSPEKLIRCLESIIIQDFKVNEVVLVEDGPITDALMAVISEFIPKFQSLNINFRPVPLPKNVGLPSALNEGLKIITSEWIFRIDSDDICLPGRFKKQFEVQQATGADILGGRIQEFSEVAEGSLTKYGERSIQLGDINSKWGYFFRNPVNHMTVLYRKEDILKLGGYQNFNGFEDYELWIRAINSNYKIYNIDSVLCKVDIEGLMRRRSGMRYIKDEAAFFFYCAKNYRGSLMFLLSGLIRASVRMLPKNILRSFYSAVTRR